MNRAKVTYIQTRLRDLGHAPGTIDGHVGPHTLAAIDRAEVVPEHWSAERKAVGALQSLLSAEGLETGPIDARWGPQTDAAWGQHNGAARPAPESRGWPSTLTGVLTEIYGKPGTNQARVACPYPLRIAWQTDRYIRSFQCHEALVRPVREAMRDVLEEYGATAIRNKGMDLFGGCYNMRMVRGGSRLSTHSWGIAVDWDPANNKLRWDHRRAAFANDYAEQWHQIWESKGFRNLGRVKNYDWMHHRYVMPGTATAWEASP